MKELKKLLKLCDSLTWNALDWDGESEYVDVLYWDFHKILDFVNEHHHLLLEGDK